MTRVLMAWHRPQQLSDAEAQAWLWGELRRLRGLPEVESVVLTRVTSSSHPRPWDWVCELGLAVGADGDACVQHPLCTEWLLDLRLLGMRPLLAVLGPGEEVI